MEQELQAGVTPGLELGRGEQLLGRQVGRQRPSVRAQPQGERDTELGPEEQGSRAGWLTFVSGHSGAAC